MVYEKDFEEDRASGLNFEGDMTSGLDFVLGIVCEIDLEEDMYKMENYLKEVLHFDWVLAQVHAVGMAAEYVHVVGCCILVKVQGCLGQVCKVSAVQSLGMVETSWST